MTKKELIKLIAEHYKAWTVCEWDTDLSEARQLVEKLEALNVLKIDDEDDDDSKNYCGVV